MSKVFQRKFKIKNKEEEFKVGQFHQLKKIKKISVILTGSYVTKQSEAKQLS